MTTGRCLPILFSGAMVKAILDGRKTQTRRLVKPQPLWMYDERVPVKTKDADPNGEIKPRFQPGDSLWVRETWWPRCADAKDFGTEEVCYRATHGRSFINQPPWKPSIHMPRWASRITLEVTGVRCERLQSITEEDAEAEGVIRTKYLAGNPFVSGALNARFSGEQSSFKTEFQNLWNSIHGADAWDANPYVWVYEFRRSE